MKRVVLINEVIPQYRVPFFDGLTSVLQARGVDLVIAQGVPTESFAARGDAQPYQPSVSLKQWNFGTHGHDLVWLDTNQVRRGADLVIAIQQVRQLQNLALWGLSQLGRLNLAWWGHGRDFGKDNRNSPGERLKRLVSARGHWWFAYNHLAARTVADLGFPENRITTVMNSTDTVALERHRDRTTPAELDQLRGRLGLGPGPIGIYVGAMAAIKQVPYLLASAEVIRARHPDFQLLMVGSGPDEASLHTKTLAHPWIHWLGPRFDRDKVQLMLLAQVCLLPAWVGLGIVDAFALDLPLITTDTFPHSVEIDYLEHGVNGWMVTGRPDPAAYGLAVADLLKAPDRLARLREGCRISARAYTMEAMVANFAEGILAALEAPPTRRGGA